ncbi:hypothetical protein B0J17DRAFT_666670 [Rhizoctonia solani]|nr:hypothetical protein B0J17DRAFT_666670 [Rhizoctonia solani]
MSEVPKHTNIPHQESSQSMSIQYPQATLLHQTPQTGADSSNLDSIDSPSDESSSFASCMTHLSLKGENPPYGTKESSQLTPISILPQEVLEHIFLRFATVLPCDSEQRWVPTRKARLIWLTHVSARWRHIAINLPILWSHIDITLDPEKTACLTLAAARTFVARAGRSLFEVHVIAHSLLRVETFRPVKDFLISISHFIQYLNIWASNSLTGLRSVYRKGIPWNPTESILGACFINAAAGTFKVLHIANMGPGFMGHHSAISDRFMARSDLESTLRQITVITLYDAFFPWDSLLYSGLVELRLKHGQNIEIDDAQFTTLLASSPRLRVLELGLEIVETPDSSTPVLLEHLEVLIIENKAGTVLKLITLGVKLLCLSIGYTYDDWGRPVGLLPYSTTPNHSIDNFHDFSSLFDLLHLMPNLKQLTLKTFPKPTERISVRSPSRSSIQLDSLYLGNCQLGLHDVVSMVTRLHVQKLVIWGNSSILDLSSIPSSGVSAPMTPETPYFSFAPPPSPLAEPETAAIVKRVANAYMTKDALISKLSGDKSRLSVYRILLGGSGYLNRRDRESQGSAEKHNIHVCVAYK